MLHILFRMREFFRINKYTVELEVLNLYTKIHFSNSTETRNRNEGRARPTDKNQPHNASRKMYFVRCWSWVSLSFILINVYFWCRIFPSQWRFTCLIHTVPDFKKLVVGVDLHWNILFMYVWKFFKRIFQINRKCFIYFK